MRDTDKAETVLAAIKTLGVRIAIDDFGTGYSSLAYLRQFPIDALKIDRSFISGIAASKESGALIHTLIHTLVQLGKTLGLETLGEGIEDQHQLERLQHEHCDLGQGFLLARPLPPKHSNASSKQPTRRSHPQPEQPPHSYRTPASHIARTSPAP
jgi:EAL domain-containing protein (putative c-di-GMP-specific phosphodiesterase class I)